jgi:hypothetical protein
VPIDELGKATDRDVAPPVMLGVFEHPDAQKCTCAAHCDDRAVGFLTILWRGQIAALPVCCDHGIEALAMKRIPMVPTDTTPPDHPVMIERNGKDLAIRHGSASLTPHRPYKLGGLR